MFDKAELASYIGYRTKQPEGIKIMAKYEARIRPQEDSFFAVVVRIDNDGEENVINGYEGRFFKTRKAAEKSTSNYITKTGA